MQQPAKLGQYIQFLLSSESRWELEFITHSLHTDPGIGTAAHMLSNHTVFQTVALLSVILRGITNAGTHQLSETGPWATGKVRVPGIQSSFFQVEAGGLVFIIGASFGEKPWEVPTYLFRFPNGTVSFQMQASQKPDYGHQLEKSKYQM